MSKLSGWSLFWIALTATCIIGTVFSVIQAKKSKKESGDTQPSEEQLKAQYDMYVYANTHGVAYFGPPMSYEEWLSNRN